MVLINPNSSKEHSGNNKKTDYKREYNQTYFSGRFKKGRFERNNYFETKFKPLKAIRNDQSQLAFKGLNFVEGARNLRRAITEKEIKPADNILRELGEMLDIERINGLMHLRGFVSRAVNPVTGQKLGKEGLYVAKPIEKSLPEALIFLPRMLYREAKKLFGGKKAKEEVNTIRKNTGKLNNLLGYYLESQRYGKVFDNAFSRENIQRMKTVLKNGNKKEFDSLMKELKLRPEVVIKEAADGLKDFDRAAGNLLRNIDNKDFVQSFRKKYITGIINMSEADKAGSIMPNFSSISSQFATRVTTGAVTAGLVANDFYNLKILASDDEKKAKEKRNQMFSQQVTYTAVAAYVTYLANSVLKRMINNSLPFAVAVGTATAFAANVLSRAVNGMPLLPVNPKNLNKEPFVINAEPLKINAINAEPLNTFETVNNGYEKSLSSYRNTSTFRALKGSDSKLAFSGWNAPEMVGKFRGWIAGLNDSMIKKIPSKMSFKDFKEGYERVKKANPEHAADILRIAGKHMRHLDETIPKETQGLSLSHIEKASKTNNGEVIIGRSALYRYTKSFIQDVVMFPVNLATAILRKITNLGLKLAGKEQIPKPSSSRYNPEIAVKNYMKWAKEAEARSKKSGISIIEEYGERQSSLHGPDVMKYSNSDLSNLMKLTGFVSVPFLAMDAYNTSAEETGSMSLSVEKAKQRAVQDSARQGVSYWAVKSWNSLFEDLNNHSLAGSAVSTTMNSTLYEVLTRLAVGQPITPKTHEEMKEIEKKRLRSDNWLARALGRKVETEDDKVILKSEKLRDFPGIKHAGELITIASKNSNSEYGRFKESIKAYPINNL